MNYRIIKAHYSCSEGHEYRYVVQKRFLFFFWRTLAWSFSLNTSRELVGGIISRKKPEKVSNPELMLEIWAR